MVAVVSGRCSALEMSTKKEEKRTTGSSHGSYCFRWMLAMEMSTKREGERTTGSSHGGYCSR